LNAPSAIAVGPWHAHVEALETVWAEHLGGVDRARLKIDHGYARNPAGPGDCVLLRDADGRARGALGLHARRLWNGSRAHDLRVLADFVVDEQHRTLGAALGLLRQAVAHSQAQGVSLLGWPNAASRAVARRAGLPERLTMHRYGKLLRGAYMLRGSHLPTRLVPVLAAPLDRVLAAGDRWRGSSGPRPPGLWLETPAAEAGADIDALWARRPEGLWLGERDARVLRWRFAHGNWRLSVWHPPLVQGPAGYVVWRDSPGHGGRIVEIGDFGCAALPRGLAAMLRSFARHLRGAGQAQLLSLECGGSPAVARELRRAGFVPKETGEAVIGLPAGPGAPAPDELVLTTLDRDPDL
jgi:hypothetical protein